MKITPVASPNQVAQVGPTSQQQSARERAINAYVGNKPEANAQAIQAREATERAANIAAITSGTPAPVDYVQQAQLLAKQTSPAPVQPAQLPEITEEVQPQQAAAVDKTTEIETQEEPLSEKFQLLARKERQLRAQQRQQQETLRQREEALKTKEAEIAAKEADVRASLIKRLKEDPLSVMAEAELTYDEITQRQLERPLTDPATMVYIQKLEQKLARLEEGQNQVKKTWEDAQSQSYQTAVNQIKTDAKALVQSNPDQYEAILATGSIKDVVELIEKTYKEEGVLMSVEEAAEEVENYLFEESFRLANLKKIQSRLKPAVATQAPVQEPQAQPAQQPQMKTLTNTVGSTKPLSRRERAILAARGELK